MKLGLSIVTAVVAIFVLTGCASKTVDIKPTTVSKKKILIHVIKLIMD